MLRWWIALVLTVASAPVWAQPAPAAAVTVRAEGTVAVHERRLAQLDARRRELARRYAEELAAVDRLKRQRTSWRQQRELRDTLATANDTAKQLTRVTQDHAAAVTALANARRALVQAIDAELAASPPAARKAELDRRRLQLVPQVPRRVARIVLPDLEIDPLADPEELDEQAAALRDSEQQLLREIASLDRQARELDTVARIRKQHDRAGELSRRDDDQPQRTASQSSARQPQSDGSFAPETGGTTDGNDLSNGGPSAPGFEAEASIVLSEVVDATTIETLARASRTGDPAQRALAAKRARDAVKRRLEQLQKKRAEIEALAKQRRR